MNELDEQIQEAIDILKSFEEDTTVPKNVKGKIGRIIGILNEKAESSMKVHKALHELEEIGEDTNIEPYTRTQLWNIVSLLEKVNS